MTLPEGWASATIADIADTKLGKMLDAAKNKGDPVPYLRNVNVRWGEFDLTDLADMRVTADEFVELAVRDGDVFVCEGGEPGRAAVWRGGARRLVFQKALHRVRPYVDIEPDYMAQYLRHIASIGGLSDLLTGTTIKHLPQVALQQIELNVPPTQEQRRIIAKLTALTARLDRARSEIDRAPALAERMVQKAYYRAFALDTALITLDQVTPEDAPIIYGILQPGPDVVNGVPYVRPTEIQNGIIRLEDLRRTTSTIAEQYKRATIRTGDLILTIVGTIGKVAVVPEALDGGNITQSSCRIRPHPDRVNGDFLKHWLQSPQAWSQYDGGRLGTAVPRLNLRDIRAFTIALPSLDIQHRVAIDLDAITARADRLKADAARARALINRLESAILAKAFRGDLVPQDPDDESASVLLNRIREAKAVGYAAAPKARRGRRAASADAA